MSADNYIYIDKKNKVWDCIASCVSDDIRDQKSSLLGKAKTLDDAMKIAEEYEKELESEGCYVEYGITRKLWCK